MLDEGYETMTESETLEGDNEEENEQTRIMDYGTQITDVILPIQDQFINDIRKRRKKAEYRSYLLPGVERLWFCPTGDPHRRITLMAEVYPGKTHQDKRDDGTPKKTYKYVFKEVFDTLPFKCSNPKLLSPKPQGPIYPLLPPITKCESIWKEIFPSTEEAMKIARTYWDNIDPGLFKEREEIEIIGQVTIAETEEEKEKVLWKYHDSPLAGHPGVK